MCMKGDYVSALPCFDKAIRIGVNISAAYLYCGDAYLNTGNFDKAITDCTHAIRLGDDETSAQAYYRRAVACERKGDEEQSHADLVRAKQLDPTLGE